MKGPRDERLSLTDILEIVWNVVQTELHPLRAKIEGLLREE